MSKKRADTLLFEKGLVDSREKGKRIIMEGSVFIGDQRVDKPGDKFDEMVEIHIRKNPLRYVSRGGLKLEKAIEEFDLQLADTIAMDIGASTGGFTDCMLQNKAKKVYAIDVGYGQLDWKLRSDSRVVVMERTNVRYIDKETIKESIDFVSIDVSFISLKLVLPVAKSLLGHNGQIVALIKPQFEAGREKVGKKGIIRDKTVHIDVVNSIVEFCNSINLGVKNISFSPITGTKGNIEFLIHLINEGSNDIDETIIVDVVEKGHSLLI